MGKGTEKQKARTALSLRKRAKDAGERCSPKNKTKTRTDIKVSALVKMFEN